MQSFSALSCLYSLSLSLILILSLRFQAGHIDTSNQCLYLLVLYHYFHLTTFTWMFVEGKCARYFATNYSDVLTGGRYREPHPTSRPRSLTAYRCAVRLWWATERVACSDRAAHSVSTPRAGAGAAGGR